MTSVIHAAAVLFALNPEWDGPANLTILEEFELGQEVESIADYCNKGSR